MNTCLHRTHPVQLVLGGLLIAEELATKNRQLSLAVLCEKAAEWACESRAVLVEIAQDAGNGELLVEEIARDGIITITEARQARGLFAEIGTQAREGRIL